MAEQMMKYNKYRPKRSKRDISIGRKRRRADAIQKNSVNSEDGWLNLAAGLGQTSDKTQYTTPDIFQLLTDEELGNLYANGGIGSKIINAVSDDMTREGFEIDKDEKKKIFKKLQKLKYSSVFNKAICWQRLYGGSIVMLMVQDGKELEEPLDIKNVKEIESLKVYDRSQIDMGLSTFHKDVREPNYGEVETYYIHQTGIFFSTPFRVHSSRCLEFYGRPIPKNLLGIDIDTAYWGVSEIQMIWNELKDFEAAFRGTSNLLLEFVIGKYKIKGLAQKLAAGQESQVIKRMEIINLYKSIINGVLLDSEMEDYTRDSASTAGLAELLDRYMMRLSGVAQIPLTRLFGRSPAGLNATGESDLDTYYDMVSSKQETDLKDPTQKLIDLISINLKLGEPGSHAITFNPLRQMTEKEEAEIYNQQSQGDKTYIEMGVVEADEIRQERFPDLPQMTITEPEKSKPIPPKLKPEEQGPEEGLEEGEE